MTCRISGLVRWLAVSSEINGRRKIKPAVRTRDTPAAAHRRIPNRYPGMRPVTQQPSLLLLLFLLFTMHSDTLRIGGSGGKVGNVHSPTLALHMIPHARLGAPGSMPERVFLPGASWLRSLSCSRNNHGSTLQQHQQLLTANQETVVCPLLSRVSCRRCKGTHL